MAAGKPVILTDDCGLARLLPRAIDAGPDRLSCGWMVKARSVAGLEQALEAAFADPDRLAEIGAAGRRIAKTRFSWNANARGLRDRLLVEPEPWPISA